MESDKENSDMEVEDTDEGDTQKTPDMTSVERTLLLDIVNEFKHIVEDKSRKFGTNKAKKNTWEVITTRFNSEVGVTKRTCAQIRGWWNNKKKRSKKMNTKSKRVRKGTGGGPSTSKLKPDTLRVIGMIPEQMNSLENRFDSDHTKWLKEADKALGLNPVTHADNMQQASNDKENDGDVEDGDAHDKQNAGNPKPSPTVQHNVRKYKDARSSLTDMEYEEHKVRLRTLYLQFEEANIQKDLAKSVAEFTKEEHNLRLELLKAQIQQAQGAGFNVQIV